jgi:2-hydroxy-4-carboxymuconate semialdehyde hemiacetal dehydrogenase
LDRTPLSACLSPSKPGDRSWPRRYIGDTATYIARYDDLFTGKDEKIDVSKVEVSMNGIELQDREFFAAIREGREPNSSVAQVLPCYRVLDGLQKQLAQA